MTDVKRPPKLWHLKCWPEYYTAIKSGEKTFEVREGTDRDYQVGDYLYLWKVPKGEEMNPQVCARIMARITYVMNGGFGIPEGVYVLGFVRFCPNHVAQGEES